MENIKSSSNPRNASSTGKPPYLPPKIPFPTVSPSFADFTPKGFASPKEANNYSHHQRTSSESVLLEESPSWLDDLLNEADTPVRKGGHRRSSSDSFAYIDVSNSSTTGYKNKNLNSVPSWGSQDFERYKDVQRSFFPEATNSKLQNWGVSSSVSQGASGVSSTALQKQKSVDSVVNDLKSISELRDSSSAKAYGSDSDTKSSNAKAYASDSDTKRAKQQFAQRSRVRKLQYIAELERNVQALQAEGSEISAELEFVNQQNLILNMENQTLKQRMDSLAQEQMIKYMEQEMLEREVGRLRTVCHQLQHHQQQQQQQAPSSSLRRNNSRDFDSQHRRNNSKDLDSQLANFSLKQ